MKKILPLLLTSLLFASPSTKELHDYFTLPAITSLPITDWTNPTIADLKLIDAHNSKKKWEIHRNPKSLRLLDEDTEGWITYRMGRVQLAPTDDSAPYLEIDDLGNDPNQKELCIICYGSYNNADRDYIHGIDQMKAALQEHNFPGHFIFRIGGWPNLKKGRLKYADVPYGFKPFFIEEVRDMGYKKVLWLDSAVMPVQNLAPLFRHIEKRGICFFSQGQMPSYRITYLSHVINALNVPTQVTFIDILSQVVGLDFTKPHINDFFDDWIKATEGKVAFFEPSADQASFALLIHKHKLLKGILPSSWMSRQGTVVPPYPPNALLNHNYHYLDTP